MISIHALREESDQKSQSIIHKKFLFQSTLSVRRATQHAPCVAVFQRISIHALREESDNPMLTVWYFLFYFNPRSPWGERPSFWNIYRRKCTYFNPRSPWGERHIETLDIARKYVKISIHALREESEANSFPSMTVIWIISIHALREESDELEPLVPQLWAISIHALREESDGLDFFTVRLPSDFNPRSPWGERPWWCGQGLCS